MLNAYPVFVFFKKRLMIITKSTLTKMPLIKLLFITCSISIKAFILLIYTNLGFIPSSFKWRKCAATAPRMVLNS